MVKLIFYGLDIINRGGGGGGGGSDQSHKFWDDFGKCVEILVKLYLVLKKPFFYRLP